MALNPLDLIFQDGATGTGAGLTVGFGVGERYGNTTGKPNQNQFTKYIKFFTQFTDTATGGTATVQIQDSANGSVWTTRYTRTFTIPASAPFKVGWRFLFKTQKRYVRANISAMAGTTAPKLNVYGTVGTYGA